MNSKDMAALKELIKQVERHLPTNEGGNQHPINVAWHAWKQSVDAEELRNGDPGPNCVFCKYKSYDGHCHRFPPTTVAIATGDAKWPNDVLSVFPYVGDGGSWCGEYELAEIHER